MSVTPVFELAQEHKDALQSFRQSGDQAAINRYMIDNSLPTSLDVFTYNFAVREGHFVAPNRHEEDMAPPTMMGRRTDFRASDQIYASINYFEVDVNPQAMDYSLSAEDDQVFIDDVIVDGSLCVGQDCVNGENFGFDTQRLKENNLRIHFNDTSASASFPSNDWRLVANDSTNGGDNYFSIEDSTAGTTPFRVEAGAGNNALHVDASGGNVGMGTNTPAVELQVTDGDSPTLRLEQNGSNGWTPQSWDVAGNETNFFVRDVTNGSKLPFKIKPGAPDNAIYVAANGNIGLGTSNPGSRLQLESGDLYVKSGNLNMDAGNLTMTGDILVTGRVDVTGDARYRLSNKANFIGTDGTTNILQINGSTNRVGIGKVNPDHLLELGTDDAVKPNGGSWSAPSDRRLKTNIRDYNDGLAQVMAIRPVRYHYNGKLDMPTDKEFIGLIAQEIREVAPYTVRSIDKGESEEEGYLFVDGTPLTYMLINAVQEQQEIINTQENRIEQLEAQLDEVAQLRQEVAALAKLLEANATSKASEDQSNVSRDRK